MIYEYKVIMTSIDNLRMVDDSLTMHARDGWRVLNTVAVNNGMSIVWTMQRLLYQDGEVQK